MASDPTTRAFSELRRRVEIQARQIEALENENVTLGATLCLVCRSLAIDGLSISPELRSWWEARDALSKKVGT